MTSNWPRHQAAYDVVGQVLGPDPWFQSLDAHVKASIRGACALVLQGEKLRNGRDPILEAALTYLPRDQIEARAEHLHRLVRGCADKIPLNRER